MKYFFDTEFIEDGKTIDLISIGIVAEDGRELYLLNYDCDHSMASDWVKANVLNYLPEKIEANYGYANEIFDKYKDKIALQQSVSGFCDPVKYGNPEFWAAWAAYDWVAFCQLFGRMIDLPDGYPYYCRDVIQWTDQLGLAREVLPPSTPNEHHALADAHWVKRAYEMVSIITN